MKEQIKWWFVHALHWALLYVAIVAQLDGAMYLLKFFVWSAAPLSPLLLTESSVKEAAKKPYGTVRGPLNWVKAWVTLGLLVWNAHIATGLAWSLVMLMRGVHANETRKARAQTAAIAA